jgi:hypothetical protein
MAGMNGNVSFDIQDYGVSRLSRKAPKKRSRTPIEPHWILIGLAIIVATFFAFQNVPETAGTLPKDLYGEWATTNSKYRDRSFTLEKRFLTIGTGKTDLEIYIISRVQKNREKGNIKYTLTYQDEKGIEYEFVFIHTPKTEEIHMKNRDNMVWKKVKKT